MDLYSSTLQTLTIFLILFTLKSNDIFTSIAFIVLYSFINFIFFYFFFRNIFSAFYLKFAIKINMKYPYFRKFSWCRNAYFKYRELKDAN